jgi:hypothetical protein
MKKFAAILLICIMYISASAEQYSISKNNLLSSSESLASEMGKTFQLAQNCGQDMANISPASASILFGNYFEEPEVKIIMKQYKLSVAQEKGELCIRDKIEFYILMNKIAVYIRTATPFIKK